MVRGCCRLRFCCPRIGPVPRRRHCLGCPRLFVLHFLERDGERERDLVRLLRRECDLVRLCPLERAGERERDLVRFLLRECDLVRLCLREFDRERDREYDRRMMDGEPFSPRIGEDERALCGVDCDGNRRGERCGECDCDRCGERRGERDRDLRGWRCGEFDRDRCGCASSSSCACVCSP